MSDLSETEDLIARLRSQSTEIGDRAEVEELMNEAADALAALSTPQEGDAEDVLAYLITAHRFKERGLRGAIMEPDIAIARPMARFLISEGFSRAAAPEPEWEYQCTNNINTTRLVGDPALHARQCSGKIERRRKAGPWLPVEGEKP